MTNITPFTISIDQSEIDQLNDRLDKTRLPVDTPSAPWEYGTDRTYIQKLLSYWKEDFDWKRTEEALNTLDHFLVDIDGLTTHFIHQRSSHPNAKPLIITHGWPGSIIEFMGVIEKLTQPEKWGGTADDAFHVVCPSLPGFAWSESPASSGMNARKIAERHATLMSLLGYENYFAQGGDWGAVITRQLALVAPQNCAGILLNWVPMFPTEEMMATFAELSASEQQGLMKSNAFRETGMAYYEVQSAQPQTLSYGLTDSPIGLAAWLVEKFHSWSDCGGDIENAISMDALLTNITLYWFTSSIATSMRIYREEALSPSPTSYVETPTGVAWYPEEIVYIPRKWAEAEYNIVNWHEHSKGGHFAAMEQPKEFVEDLRRFKREFSSIK